MGRAVLFRISLGRSPRLRLPAAPAAVLAASAVPAASTAAPAGRLAPLLRVNADPGLCEGFAAAWTAVVGGRTALGAAWLDLLAALPDTSIAAP